MMLCQPTRIKKLLLWKRFFKKYKARYGQWQMMSDKVNYIFQHKQAEKMEILNMYKEVSKNRKELDKWMHNQFKRKDFRDAGIYPTKMGCHKECPYWSECKKELGFTWTIKENQS